MLQIIPLHLPIFYLVAVSFVCLLLARTVVQIRYTEIPKHHSWRLGFPVKTTALKPRQAVWMRQQIDDIVIKSEDAASSESMRITKSYIGFSDEQAIIRSTVATKQVMLTIGLANFQAETLETRVGIVSVAYHAIRSFVFSYLLVAVLRVLLIIILVTFQWRVSSLSYLNWLIAIFFVYNLYTGWRFVTTESSNISDFIDHESYR